MTAQHSRHFLQHLIAGQVAPGIIHPFELPQVQQNESHPHGRILGTVVQERKFIEIAPVEGPGQLVPVQLALQLLQPLSHGPSILLFHQQLVRHMADDLQNHPPLFLSQHQRQRLGDHIKYVVVDKFIFCPSAISRSRLETGAVFAAAFLIPNGKAGIRLLRHASLAQPQHRRMLRIHQAHHVKNRCKATKHPLHVLCAVAILLPHTAFLPCCGNRPGAQRSPGRFFIILPYSGKGKYMEQGWVFRYCQD